MNVMSRIANAVSVALVCKNNGLGRLTWRDWLFPWRARRRLLEHREAFARLWARELRRRQGLPPVSDNPDADLMMASITEIQKLTDAPPEGTILCRTPLLP